MIGRKPNAKVSKAGVTKVSTGEVKKSPEQPVVKLPNVARVMRKPSESKAGVSVETLSG